MHFIFRTVKSIASVYHRIKNQWRKRTFSTKNSAQNIWRNTILYQHLGGPKFAFCVRPGVNNRVVLRQKMIFNNHGLIKAQKPVNDLRFFQIKSNQILIKF